MAFRPQYTIKRGREYRVGEGTERIAFANDLKVRKITEKEKFEAETNARIDLNGSIYDKINQGWDEDEIQVAIEREFPNETPTRIRTLIKHWQEQKRKMFNEIDALINKVKNGKIKQHEADRRIKNIYNHYNAFKKTAKNYYSRKMEELGDEER